MAFAVDENEEANKQEEADAGEDEEKADAKTKNCLVAAGFRTKAKASNVNCRL
jgi:hypothetical protein